MNSDASTSVDFSQTWNDPAHWDAIYSENETDETSIYRDPKYLIKTIQRLNRPAPLKILDAGTGISALPELAAFMGHHVVAVDISAQAIKIGKSRTLTQCDLKNCFRQQYNYRLSKDQTEYFEPISQIKIDLQKEFAGIYKSGGEVLAREVCDWNDPGLIKRFGPFDIVLNQNGLRSAPPELIRQSLQSFYQLLLPGGILIETNINAIMRIKTLEKYAREAGFFLLNEMDVIYDYNNFKPELNKHDKYIVLCWPTG
jgi:SAM-dependent methyltransferase